MKNNSYGSPAPARARSPRGRVVKRPSLALSVFSEIKKEHASFRKAMGRIRKLYPSDPDRAKVAFSEFRIKLHAHTEAEEVSLYATLLENAVPGEELDDQLREGKEEHHVAEFLLNELAQIPAADPKWKAKFRVLQESVEHHLDEEEKNFENWKRKFSRAEDQLVLAQFANRRATMVAQSAAARH